MLVAINRGRADPNNVPMGTAAACSTDYTARRPLIHNHDGARAARFHCVNSRINAGGLSHDSYCTLRSDIASSGCDGSADCACEAGSEHFNCETLGGNGTSPSTRASYFGFGLNGEVGAVGYGDGWAAVEGWITECAGADGHRRILTGGSASSIGLGYSGGGGTCWNTFYFGDTGASGAAQTLPSGVHRPETGGGSTTFTFYLNYYDAGGAPQSVDLVLDGQCHPMDRELGSDPNATYITDAVPGSGCHEYWFLVRDSAGVRKVYPEEGSWGVGGCADYRATAMDAACEGCDPGDTKACGVGKCQGQQTCSPSGEWEPCDGPDPDPDESCNGIDDDCDGNLPADELDGDSDGVRLCEADCDDSDPDRYPGADEICNGIDDDCDDVLPADEQDADSDGYSACQGDCNEGNASVHPGADEVCNGMDDNCDQITDEGCPCDEDETRPCGEDEGACMPGTQTCSGGVWSDCMGEIGPVEEQCGDSLDNDCDGDTDEDCPDPEPDDIVVTGGCGCASSPSCPQWGFCTILLALLGWILPSGSGKKRPVQKL
jgi:hypothetical protein